MKKLLLVFVTLMLALSLMACGGNEEDPQTPSFGDQGTDLDAELPFAPLD